MMRRFAVSCAFVALVAAAACSSRPAARQEESGDTIGSVSSGSCIEQYSTQALAKRHFGFDGTITAVAKAASEMGVDEVTFKVNRWYKGGSAGSVTLKAVGFGGVTSAGTIAAGIGDRMLVTGEDGMMWSCGFSQAYSAEVAAEWEAAFKA